MINAKTEHYISLAIWAQLKDTFENVFKWGVRPRTEGLEEWVAVNGPEFKPVRSRRTVYRRQVMFNVGCISVLGEQRDDGDTNAPWRLAGQVRELFEHVDLEIQTIGDNPLTKVGVLNIHEADMGYVNEKNIIFGGSGDFAVDQHVVHSVTVTLAATFIQEVAS